MNQKTHPPDPILVTGSSGLLGARIVADLAAEFTVVGLDVDAPESLPDSAEFVPCDLTDDGSVKRALDRVSESHGDRIASVIHLAAYYDFAGEPSDLYQELTVEGTRRLLDGLSRFEVARFIFTSTLLVMEPTDREIITEESRLAGEWDYPKSKITTEQLLRERHGDIPITILRLAGVYDEQGHSPPITQQIKRIYERNLESFFFPGNDTHGQPFVHIDDAVAAVRKAVEKRNELDAEEVFLIAEPDALTYGEMQELIGELTHGEAWPSYRIPAAVAKAGAWVKDKVTEADQFIKPWMVDLADANYPVSVAKAERQLSWRATHRLRDTLPAMIAELQKDSEAFYAENGLDE